MPQIDLDGRTLQRLDDRREDGEEYDEIINELINILQAEESTLFATGDER